LLSAADASWELRPQEAFATHIYLWLLRLGKLFHTHAVMLHWLIFQLAKIKPYPVHPLARPSATHHPLHAQSPTAAFPSHTFSEAIWPLIPAGAAGQRETAQEISTLSWLSTNNFKGKHRSYLQETGWKRTACAGKLVPVFYPIACRISIRQGEFKTTFAKASYTGSAGWSFPAARAVREDGQHLQPLL